MGPSAAWRVPPASNIHWREWDHEFVVYHEQSGDTHRLNPVGAAVLRMLATETLTAAQLSIRLPSVVDPATGGTAVPIETLLEQLSAVGLIEPVHPDGDAPGA